MLGQRDPDAVAEPAGAVDVYVIVGSNATRDSSVCRDRDYAAVFIGVRVR